MNQGLIARNNDQTTSNWLFSSHADTRQNISGTWSKFVHNMSESITPQTISVVNTIQCSAPATIFWRTHIFVAYIIVWWRSDGWDLKRVVRLIYQTTKITVVWLSTWDGENRELESSFFSLSHCAIFKYTHSLSGTKTRTLTHKHSSQNPKPSLFFFRREWPAASTCPSTTLRSVQPPPWLLAADSRLFTTRPERRRTRFRRWVRVSCFPIFPLLLLLLRRRKENVSVWLVVR